MDGITRGYIIKKMAPWRVICQSLPTTMAIIMQFGIVSFYRFFRISNFLVQVPSLLLCQNLTNIMSRVFPNPNSLHQNNINDTKA